MSLFGSKIKKEDWEIRKNPEKSELFYEDARLKWVKRRHTEKYESDICVICGDGLTDWVEMYGEFMEYLQEEYGEYNAVLPSNICVSCALRLYDRTIRDNN